MPNENRYNIKDNLADNLQEFAGPFIDIPHPTPIQIFQDFFFLVRTLPDRSAEMDQTPIKSILNTPVLDQLSFEIYVNDITLPETENITKYASQNINPDFYVATYTDVILTLAQTKKIVMTDISGNDGSVKELIGLGDFEINVTGRLFAPYGQSPKADSKYLKQILDVPQSLKISSKYLNNLGITNMVIKSYDFPQMEGEYSTQYFTINAISDFNPENNFIKFRGFQ